MRFEIKFRLSGKKQVLPFNYQYPLSSWIYKLLDKADPQFAAFLHEHGHQLENLKTFKFFTFSNLRFPRQTCKAIPKTDRMEVWARNAWLDVSFQLPATSEKFIVGLFKDQQAEIGDRISQIEMEVESVEVKPVFAFSDNKARIKAQSPVVIGLSQEGKTHETYISPTDPGLQEKYKELFLKNLMDKYHAYCRETHTEPNTFLIGELDFKCLTENPKSRKQTIKAHTKAETEVRGFLFDFEITAPKDLIELGLNAGFGSMNALGFGCGEAIDGD
ncbi:MAG: CRISPR-associated endoribonuclease Cas6 [Bacteroidales bacterium]|nr:CRISPR-associated endoribonuclease Cas6 [Bacteroidales bacterium]